MIAFDASSFSERMGNGGRSGKGGGAEAHRQLLSGGPDRPAGESMAGRNGAGHAERTRAVKPPGGREPEQKRGKSTDFSIKEEEKR